MRKKQYLDSEINKTQEPVRHANRNYSDLFGREFAHKQYAMEGKTVRTSKHSSALNWKDTRTENKGMKLTPGKPSQQWAKGMRSTLDNKQFDIISNQLKSGPVEKVEPKRYEPKQCKQIELDGQFTFDEPEAPQKSQISEFREQGI